MAALTIEFPQTVWTVEFGGDEIVVAEVTMTGGTGGGGTFDGVHNDLDGRSTADAHPISAITGLQDALDAAGTGGSLADLTDVDVTTDPPAPDDVLAWDGTNWTPATLDAGSGLELGETSSTAYRGDRGKTAYDHSQVVTGNPHGTTAADVGAQPADSDLTTIAGLTPTTDSFMQAKAGAWAARTIAEVKTDLGISSPHLFITPAINDYVGMPSPNVAAHGIAAYVLGATGRGNISPIWLPGATYDRIGVYVQSGGTATLRLGLYTADATTGLPGTKVFDAGTISTASTGLIEATISQTLAAGWYWAAVVNDAHTSTFDLMGWSDSIAPTIFGSASQTSAPFRQRVALASSSWTTGGLTTSPPTLSWQAAGVKVVLRRSA